jgi:hypothetical protein
MPQTLQTDYLIIGAGAMGMAFADELVSQSKDVSIILVDRRSKPGGHWNNAYSFVTLHQPAVFYGVNSVALATSVDDLASASRMQAYYERVMDKLCASGQVRFLSQCSYEGQGQIRSLSSTDVSYQVTVRKRTVDASYSRVEVPSTRPPAYGVADGISLIPINGLAALDRPWDRYVVIGAGKTGMDALLFLLDRGVDPDKLTWIISNDCWLIPRKDTLPKATPTRMPKQMRCLIECRSLQDVYDRFEARGWILRLDKAIAPTKFRCATVSLEELDKLRALPHKVRMGRVQRIESTQIVLAEGVIPTNKDVLHIDCTAHGLARRPARPIFEEGKITLQPVTLCQPAFSACFIGMVEMRRDDDATKNTYCTPVPHPEHPVDIVSCSLHSFTNAITWLKPFGWWLTRCRLGIVRHLSVLEAISLLISLIRFLGPASRSLEQIQLSHSEALPADAEQP